MARVSLVSSLLKVLIAIPFLSYHVQAASLRSRQANTGSGQHNASVLILGGGVTGVIAARTLHEQGIDDFIIVEARDELGGRMQNKTIGGKYTVEQGPNWVQGTQTGDGPANPILLLTQKHNVTTQFNDLFGSISTYYPFPPSL